MSCTLTHPLTSRNQVGLQVKWLTNFQRLSIFFYICTVEFQLKPTDCFNFTFTPDPNFLGNLDSFYYVYSRQGKIRKQSSVICIYGVLSVPFISAPPPRTLTAILFTMFKIASEEQMITSVTSSHKHNLSLTTNVLIFML